MRDIRFRAWHEYGAAFKGGRKNSFKPGMIYDDKPGDCLVWKNNGQRILDILQFTGLKDKNDKDIYEGDIVEYVFNRKRERAHIIYETQFGKWTGKRFPGAMAENLGLCWVARHAEVIGNIHETPELLTNKG